MRQHRFGQVHISIPDAPAWGAWPVLIAYRGRGAGQSHHQPLSKRSGDGVEILLCLEGRGELVQGAQRQPLGIGDAVILRLAVDDLRVAGVAPPAHWRTLHVTLQGDQARAAADALIRAGGHVRRVDPAAALWTELLACVPGGFGHARVWTVADGLATGARLLAMLQAVRAAPVVDDPLVAAALDIMRRVWALRSVTDVAIRLEVSREHLSRRLAAAGIAAGPYFRRLRAERAAALLLENRNLSIAEVARKCGWRSADALAAAVRAVTGRSPRALRSNHG